MKVATLFEMSGRVRDAFIEEGHEAISYDILPSESDKGPHIMGDVTKYPKSYFSQYDLIVAFPPCTYFSVAGNRWFKIDPSRYDRQSESLELVKWVWSLPVDKLAMENVVGFLQKLWRPHDQVIQPYEYGDDYEKRTALWLRGLPPLMPTEINIAYKRNVTQQKRSGSVQRSRFSKYVAKAMAKQWGSY